MTKQTELSPEFEQEVPAQPVNEPGSPSQETDWAEIGQHFWVLGESLSNALRDALQREDNRQQLHKLQTGLQGVAGQVSQTVKEVVESPEFQPVQAAGQRTFHELQPYLLSGLRQLRNGLDKLISSLEPPAPDPDEAAVKEVTL
ncbi:MAG TPA: hypothetical protein VEC96_14885 [Anaerolineae bacterium]|nr:hypothetical protein [Anaerolineae bacterium]HXW00067.1 hypothetical protein [Anaerolineae bacterium]